ncbi:MAG: chemotaxis protein CheA [Tissierellia bacterium]|nr:chemotaxis protein CheA [Tissierellia bacterium]
MDNNFAVLDMYLFETNSLLEQLDSILLEAESELGFGKEYIDEIFRIMHTIKGSSAMMQFDSITDISHKIEDLFYYIRENGIDSQYNEKLVNLVFKFTDFIKGEITKIEEGQQLEENIEPFEKEILEFLNTISNGEERSMSEKAVERSETDTPDMGYIIKVNFDDEIQMENLRAYIIVNQLREAGVEFKYKPENIENSPETSKEIVENGFFIYLDSKEDLDLAVNIVRESLNVKNYTVMENEETIKEETKNSATSQLKETEDSNNKTPIIDTDAKHSKQSLITVNLTKLDQLVDIVGELVIAESMVESDATVRELNSESFKKATRQVRKLTDELQDIVMSLRMVPVSGIFQRMKRIVRDMGKELDKEVELILKGEETEIDKTIVDTISDPIMHLVRNAMDHGIEAEEERVEKGKDKKGKIMLLASNAGGEIHITVEDDGRGLDPEQILEKAKAKGLLTKPESEYSQKDIYQLLMVAGFSTNEAVTEYSGRGVGMDVVKSNVEKVGGTVLVDSKPGVGTRITFKIPLTLTIVSGMQVLVGETEFIIPIKNIQQSFIAKEEDIIHDNENNEMIIIRERCYPIIRASQYFNIESQVTNIEEGILILVESGTNSICLFVDQIIGEQQVVVKPLPVVLNKYSLKEAGISGCSILGDGSINLILDIGNIIESM